MYFRPLLEHQEDCLARRVSDDALPGWLPLPFQNHDVLENERAATRVVHVTAREDRGKGCVLVARYAYDDPIDPGTTQDVAVKGPALQLDASIPPLEAIRTGADIASAPDRIAHKSLARQFAPRSNR